MNWLILAIAAALLAGIFILKRASLLPAAKAQQLLQQGASIVDVRETTEFAAGHLPGAVNIPLGTLKSELPRRFPDKNQVLLLHCLSGMRSGIARRQLRSLGYQNAYNIGSYARAESVVGETRRK